MFFLSIFNLYSFCLVYKCGCCFMNEVEKDHSKHSVETAVVMNEQISTIGVGLPINLRCAVHKYCSGCSAILYQPWHVEPSIPAYPAGPYYMAACCWCYN